jgi:hypothetical protein
MLRADRSLGLCRACEQSQLRSALAIYAAIDADPPGIASMLDSRNTVWGFGERVRKNLLFLNFFAESMHADVHVVTQLVTSLLGLIVFPYEELKRMKHDGFGHQSLDILSKAGWPTWEFEIGASHDLDDLLRHLRNAVSHRRIAFSSDSRALDQVRIAFRDRKHELGIDDWGASISGRDLLAFVLRFASLLEEVQHAPVPAKSSKVQSASDAPVLKQSDLQVVADRLRKLKVKSTKGAVNSIKAMTQFKEKLTDEQALARLHALNEAGLVTLGPDDLVSFPPL